MRACFERTMLKVFGVMFSEKAGGLPWNQLQTGFDFNI